MKPEAQIERGFAEVLAQLDPSPADSRAISFEPDDSFGGSSSRDRKPSCR